MCAREGAAHIAYFCRFTSSFSPSASFRATTWGGGGGQYMPCICPGTSCIDTTLFGLATIYMTVLLIDCPGWVEEGPRGCV